MMEQLSIFDLTMPYISVDKPIRLIELFSGVGSQAMALRDLGADFEHYRSVEFDEHAVRGYNAIHDTNFKPTDIRDIHGKDLGIVEKGAFTYLLTYSFPCQDLSAAGKRKGMRKGSGTRSGLLWEVERLLKETPELPDILLMENVPEVIGANNIDDFRLWQDFLVSKGYTNYVKVLNAKDYGVAQNRNRCFMVSLLGEYNYHFPEPIPLTKCIDDYCEDSVDESYYINTEKAQNMIKKAIEDGRIEVSKTDSCPFFEPREKDTGQTEEHMEIKEIGNLKEGQQSWKSPQNGRVYDVTGISPTLNTCGGGGLEVKIVEKKVMGRIYTDVTENFNRGLYPDVSRTIKAVKNDAGCIERQIVASRGRNPDNPSDRTAGMPTEQVLEPNTDGVCNALTTVQKDNMLMETVKIKQATKDGYAECRIGGVADLSYPESETRRGRVIDGGNVSPTLMASQNEIYRIVTQYRVRKLKPKEYWRLMGFSDEDYEKAAGVNSKTQLYKQAGNSIVKDVLMAIFSQLNIKGVPMWNEVHP